MLQNAGMGKALGAVLKKARDQRAMSQEDVAYLVGVSRAAVGQWESGTTEPATDNLIKVCRTLNIDLVDATNGKFTPLPSDNIVAAIEARTDSELKVPITMPPVPGASLPSDVPVMGVAVGGPDADFYMNGQVVDYVRRPNGIQNARDVYALYVVGDSMSPRFEPGELVYVSPSRAPVVGDYVIVQMKEAEDGEPKKAFIKRLVKRGPPSLVVEQHNPHQTIKFDSAKVESIHRVMRWNDLLGF